MRDAGCEKGFPLPLCTGYSRPLRHCGRFAGVCRAKGSVARGWSAMARDQVGDRVCSGRRKERGDLGRRSGRSSSGQAQVGEELLNNRGIFDACPEPAKGAAMMVKGPPHFGQAVMSEDGRWRGSREGPPGKVMVSVQAASRPNNRK